MKLLESQTQTPTWNSSPNPNLDQSQEPFQPGTWVRLLELPNPYSFDEALLLCQISQDQWVSWIPDHGEATLHISQFF
ncbi:MAG: hypothetical protein F6K50_21750 [Moorea sp. SIO3I7]|uniref:hypothetical protein n=1 Tax=unclassified Moorena TaxID=2683338 RepID=UPI0013C24D6E|nr:MULTISPECIES: hypothetical protein [unclassified Moorena]NEN98044.1 hypothetical protein [Moorena sp. SIO3I7]NEO67018.1 hypothetical protein [Moorena sp. SIO4G2]NEO06934.1 hypothetical protein [Moorena sp. SIO3I8]NEO25084.1 hypothetical protein [Moorena sp. SIO4A5]NEQ62312.1 hypothetical protein [Moorena sp. SIO4A1]